SLQGRHNVVIRVGRCVRYSGVAKVIGSQTSSAVSHSGHHEQAVEISYRPRLGARLRVSRQKRVDLPIVENGAERRNSRVTPTMVLNELAAARPKGPQIRVVRVQHLPGSLVSQFHIAVKVQGSIVPFQILEYDVLVERISKHELERAPR